MDLIVYPFRYHVQHFLFFEKLDAKKGLRLSVEICIEGAWRSLEIPRIWMMTLIANLGFKNI